MAIAVNVNPAETTAGWQAKLDMHYAMVRGRSLLSHKHVGPLRVQKPFFPEGGVNHTYLLHPPGGLVGDDTLTIVAEVERDAHALITTPGATKVYRNVRDTSAVKQHFNVHGAFEWLPQEIILFDGSRLQSETTFDLSAGATLIAWEVQCLGRPVGELPYRSGEARFDTRINIDGRALLRDRLVLAGGAPIMEAPWGLGGATALGVMLAYPADLNLRDVVRLAISGLAPKASVTLLDELLVVRAMTEQSQDIRRVFSKVWEVVRPSLLKRKICEPRIWAT